MTASKKYQIFISSTFKDLVDERQVIYKSTLDLDQIPSGMELFPAADQDQFEYIKQVIDECDYYVLILGARYGSVDKEGISYTELEYNYAVETGKNVIALVHGDVSAIPLGKADTDVELSAKLASFRGKSAEWEISQSLDQPGNLASGLSKISCSRDEAVSWCRLDTRRCGHQ